jgi:outer membrane receptor protein involved in Fe transport
MTPRVELGADGPTLVVPVIFDNSNSRTGYGVEVATSYEVTDAWRITATGAHHEFEGADGDRPMLTPAVEDSPRNVVHLMSYWTLPARLELDAAYRYVGELSEIEVPGYGTVDVRLGWRPVAGADVNLRVSNLLDNEHYEFRSTLGEQETRVGRQISVEVSWVF